MEKERNVLAKYPLETGRTVHWQCAAETDAQTLVPGVLGSRAHTGAPSRASHLVFCRLVPMCGFQDGDELSVLGVGPAANAWREKTIR